MKFAILALLGWGAAIKFRPDPSRSPWAIKADPAPKSPITGAFEPWESGSGYYDRVVPDRFSEGSDDLLMRSLITTYALEGKGEDGQPNGKFFLRYKDGEKVATEVIQTHLGYTGEKNDEYRAKHFSRAWDKFD